MRRSDVILMLFNLGIYDELFPPHYNVVWNLCMSLLLMWEIVVKLNRRLQITFSEVNLNNFCRTQAFTVAEKTK